MDLLCTKFRYSYLGLEVYHALTHKYVTRELSAIYPLIKAQYIFHIMPERKQSQ
jgi:hypothetical protein